MLLFRAGGPDPRRCRSGWSRGWRTFRATRSRCRPAQPVTQYRGRLMPLVPMSGALDTERPRQPVLVFTTSTALGATAAWGWWSTRSSTSSRTGCTSSWPATGPGLLGTAVIAGHATDVIDTGYWLTQASTTGSAPAAAAGVPRRARVLMVEDSDFFRQLLVPALAAAGYEVTAAEAAAEALRLRDAGVMFDAIVSDIEMPDMDGLDFVRTRARGRRLGGAAGDRAERRDAEPHEVEAGRDAGFTDYVGNSSATRCWRACGNAWREPVPRREPRGRTMTHRRCSSGRPRRRGAANERDGCSSR